jgi:hypothetical protein
MKRPVLFLIAAAAGAAVGVLLTARFRWQSKFNSKALPLPGSDDRSAEIIRQYAPTLDEIAREATRESRQLREECRSR